MAKIVAHRKIRLSFPTGFCLVGLKIKQEEILIPTTGLDQTVYKTVELFKKDYFQTIKTKQSIITPRLDLADLITLHNDDGIKDLGQVANMFQRILNKGHIFEDSGIPNVKVVLSKEKHLVLFDGHHTTLAYLLAGVRYLETVPHILISNGKDAMTDDEMADFFGHHRAYVLANGWQGLTVNWQAAFAKQISPRKQNTVGEVFRALEKKLKKAAKENNPA